ncbi:hypothetical protein ACLOJK_032296 [Asimina triloba]
MGTEERATTTTEAEVEAVYKTKVVQFFDRSVPIILQNDNGPCPLIAIRFYLCLSLSLGKKENEMFSSSIPLLDKSFFPGGSDFVACRSISLLLLLFHAANAGFSEFQRGRAMVRLGHIVVAVIARHGAMVLAMIVLSVVGNVLLLRNNLNLSLDTSEVPLQKLLSLVAERLIDSNSNVEDKDLGYVQNQEKNIADAMERLHHLATGIDVNLHFRKIDDFEFTPERAIFDLLGIELYHGWIIDPQDTDTFNAIGSKSYNALIGELVSLETRHEEEDKHVLEEDSVDFAAATTAALGVPSPCLSRGRSFEDSPVSVSSITSNQKVRKGDVEEEEELMRVLQLSKADVPPSPQLDDLSYLNQSSLPASSEERVHQQFSNSGDFTDNSQSPTHIECQRLNQIELNASKDMSECSNCDSSGLPSSSTSIEPSVSLLTTTTASLEQSKISESATSGNNSEIIRDDVMIQNQPETFLFPDRDVSIASCTFRDQMSGRQGDQIMLHAGSKETSLSFDHLKPADNLGYEPKVSSAHGEPSADSDSFEGVLHTDVSEGMASSMDGSEPIYEGEERILDVGLSTFENREPMYEGEIVLAVQADGINADEDAQQKCKGPLSINAEQGIQFRISYNGELYLLATDQGYINQPDLVWEKLNEVNGDSVFMTGNFQEFKAENQANDSWDEQNAVTSTADYLASIDNSTVEGSTLNSDLQLAIALQQQEFESQSQRQTPHNVQQSNASSHSRLVTGPQLRQFEVSTILLHGGIDPFNKRGRFKKTTFEQVTEGDPQEVPRSSNSSSTKHDAKTKEKCTVM